MSSFLKWKSPWLYNQFIDVFFILFPPFFSVGIVLIFRDEILKYQSMPLWIWVVLVLMIDVSHVYSTLFRTYFHEWEYRENKLLLVIIPFLVWIGGVFLHSISGVLFWRILAYLAVFHFIRQQFGFMRLYSSGDENIYFSRQIDKLMIYNVTIYPILYWHFNLPRNFNWFIKGDFITGLSPIYSKFFGFLYLLIIIIYIVKELLLVKEIGIINFPKNSVIAGTALSWGIGIIIFNNDIIFTATNVITHGIPYIALIWIFGKKQENKNSGLLIFQKFRYGLFFRRYSLPLFLGVILFFAYLEEGIWAGSVWKEHLDIFPGFINLEKFTDRSSLTWLVPLLSVPQVTHYIIDGFIWRLKKKEAYWKQVLF